MRVQVVRVDDPSMWYSDKVGEYLDVISVDDEFYWTYDDGGYFNIINKRDVIKIVDRDYSINELRKIIQEIENGTQKITKLIDSL